MTYPVMPPGHNFIYTAGPGLHAPALMLAANPPPGGYSCYPDSKTKRFTQTQFEFLEAEFQKDNKPTTAQKRNFAGVLNVSIDRINNWFQNRRAKKKQEDKRKPSFDGEIKDEDGLTDPSPISADTEDEDEKRPSSSPVNRHASLATGLDLRPSSSHHSLSQAVTGNMAHLPVTSFSLPPTPTAFSGQQHGFPGLHSYSGANGFAENPMAFASNAMPNSFEMSQSPPVLSSMSPDMTMPNANLLPFNGVDNSMPPPPTTEGYIDGVNGISQAPIFNEDIFNQNNTLLSTASTSMESSMVSAPPVTFEEQTAIESTSIPHFDANWASFMPDLHKHSPQPPIIQTPIESEFNTSTTNVLMSSGSMQDQIEIQQVRRSSSSGLSEHLGSTSLTSPTPSLPFDNTLDPARSKSSLAMRRNRRGPTQLPLGPATTRHGPFTSGFVPRSPASPGIRKISSTLKNGQSSFRIEKPPQSARALHSQPSPAALVHAQEYVQQHAHNQIVTTPGISYSYDKSMVPSTPMTATGTHFLTPNALAGFPFTIPEPTPPFTPSDHLGSGQMMPHSAPPTQLTFGM